LRSIDIAGEQLTKVLSLADADAIAARSPLLGLASPAIRLSGMKLKMPVFFDALLTPSGPDRKLRIMLRSREHLDAVQKAALIAAVQQTVADHTGRPGWQAAAGSEEPGRVTGYYVMIARLVANLVGDQWRCFFVSAALVWLLLLLATRSLPLATAALLPNLLPILVVLAGVGLIGGKLNMGAAMIAAVSIGLSIDGSVHFLNSYGRCRARGHGVEASAIHAAGGIGVAVLLATVALVAGFSILASSEFVPTATFGILVAVTLAAGTLVNLTLLPALVSWVKLER
jgi:predicted RND superfamily exporter protein